MEKRMKNQELSKKLPERTFPPVRTCKKRDADYVDRSAVSTAKVPNERDVDSKSSR